MAVGKCPFLHNSKVINVVKFLHMSIKFLKVCQDLEIPLSQTQFKLYTGEDLDRIFIVRAYYPNFRQSNITSS